MTVTVPDNECLLCGAPGGYPYCNDDCYEADQDDGTAPTAPTGEPTVGLQPPTGDPWDTAPNHRR